jgi:hypothetical protein
LYYESFQKNIFGPTPSHSSVIDVNYLDNSNLAVEISFLIGLPKEEQDNRKLSFKLLREHGDSVNTRTRISISLLQSYQGLYHEKLSRRPVSLPIATSNYVNFRPTLLGSSTSLTNSRGDLLLPPISLGKTKKSPPSKDSSSYRLAPANSTSPKNAERGFTEDESTMDEQTEDDHSEDETDEMTERDSHSASMSRLDSNLSSFFAKTPQTDSIVLSTPLNQAITKLENIAKKLESRGNLKRESSKIRAAIKYLSANSSHLLDTSDTSSIVSRQAKKSKFSQNYIDDEVEEFLRQSFTKSHEASLKRPNRKDRPSFKGVVNAILAGQVMRKMMLKKAALIPYIEEDAVKEHMKLFHRWDFDVFKLAHLTNGKPLYCVVYNLFNQFKLFENLPIKKDKLHMYLRELEENYGNNPYHNSTHAADVVHATVFLMQACDITKYCTPEELMAAILGAAVHDFMHPGLTNFFLVKTKHKLATKYNDKSILESFHVSSAFKLLGKENYSFLEGLNDEQYRTVRSTMIELVLATDIAEHQQALAAFKAAFDVKFHDEKIRKDQALIFLTKADRMLVLRMCIKMADVNNCAKPLYLHAPWVKRVITEFLQMGDMEKELGVPVSPFCNREACNIGKCQLGFTDFIVMPLYKTFSEYFKNTEFCINEIKQVQRYWARKTEITKPEEMDTLITEQLRIINVEPCDMHYSGGRKTIVCAKEDNSVPPNILL